MSSTKPEPENRALLVDVETQLRPTSPDRRRAFPVLLVLAQFGFLLALLAPVVVSLSIKVSIIDPVNTGGSLGLILGVGSLMSVIATPLFGNLSDRSRSRFGRRRPFLVGGALVGTLGLVVIGVSDAIPGVLAGWALTQLAMNAGQAAISGLYADRIPEQLRGRVGAFLGLATNFGAVGGAAMATALSPNLLLIFLVPGLVAIAFAGILALYIKDAPAQPEALRPFSVMEIVRSYGWPVRSNRDFTINFISRFLIWLGFSALMTYQALLFIQHFGVNPQNVAGYMLAATAISGAGTLLGSIGGGWISDKVDRRKGFVLTGGLLIGVSLLLVGLAPTPELVFAAGALGGLGLGVYIAVDLALAARLVPDKNNAGRYMGIVTLANNLPNVVTPLLAPLLLTAGATADGRPGFTLLFLVAGVVSVVGSILVLAIRSVR